MPDEETDDDLAGLIDDIIALRCPPRNSPNAWEQEAQREALQQALRERAHAITSRRAAFNATSARSVSSELLLAELKELAEARDRTSEAIELLVAYAREFAAAEESLAVLAAALRMSPSGVRTAYGDRERAAIVKSLGRAPLRGSPPPVWSGERSPSGILLGVDEAGSWVAIEPPPVLVVDGLPNDEVVVQLLALINAQLGNRNLVDGRSREVVETLLGDHDQLLQHGQRVLYVLGPTAESGAPASAEDYRAAAAKMATIPNAHIVWATSEPTTLSGLGDSVMIRRPPRRNGKFWTLEVPGGAPRRLRLARPLDYTTTTTPGDTETARWVFMKRLREWARDDRERAYPASQADLDRLGMDGRGIPKASITPAADGIRVEATVRGIPAGESCSLVLLMRDGSQCVAAAFVAAGGDTGTARTVHGAASVPADQVTAVLVRNVSQTLHLLTDLS